MAEKKFYMIFLPIILYTCTISSGRKFDSYYCVSIGEMSLDDFSSVLYQSVFCRLHMCSVEVNGWFTFQAERPFITHTDYKNSFKFIDLLNILHCKGLFTQKFFWIMLSAVIMVVKPLDFSFHIRLVRSAFNKNEYSFSACLSGFAFFKT